MKLKKIFLPMTDAVNNKMKYFLEILECQLIDQTKRGLQIILGRIGLCNSQRVFPWYVISI